MTARVKFRRKNAPISTSGTKKMKIQVAKACCIYLCTSLHPSRVTHWNTARSE